jgi:hypothetical protein
MTVYVLFSVFFFCFYVLPACSVRFRPVLKLRRSSAFSGKSPAKFFFFFFFFFFFSVAVFRRILLVNHVKKKKKKCSLLLVIDVSDRPWIFRQEPIK